MQDPPKNLKIPEVYKVHVKLIFEEILRESCEFLKLNILFQVYKGYKPIKKFKNSVWT